MRLARFVETLEYRDLDLAVTTATKEVILDTLGACYAGTPTGPGNRILEYVATFDGDAAAVVGRPDSSIAHMAALANGTTAHALDVDDGHRGASAHPGSAVIPAALALAEKHDIDGKSLVTAVVAWYEAMVPQPSPCRHLIENADSMRRQRRAVSAQLRQRAAYSNSMRGRSPTRSDSVERRRAASSSS